MLIIKGKIFVGPPSANDINPLHVALAAGVGRRLDKTGLPPGPWTPPLLLGALDRIGDGNSTLALRTVQRWFSQDSTRITADNVSLLARVFGCGDPEATLTWQKALANAGRKNLQPAVAVSGQPSIAGTAFPEVMIECKTACERVAAHRIDGLFKAPPNIDLPLAVVIASAALSFAAFAAGKSNASYSPMSGLVKEVGYLWAPNWTVLNLVLLPLFIYLVSRLRAQWVDFERHGVLLSIKDGQAATSWNDLVGQHNGLVLLTLGFCTFVVFGLQWFSVHLPALLSGDPGNLMIDWTLVGLQSPQPYSRAAAIGISFLAFFYTGVCLSLYLFGLSLLYFVVGDFAALRRLSGERSWQDHKIRETSAQIFLAVFRCGVIGLMMVFCMRLQATYLVSTAPSMSEWLMADARTFIGLPSHPPYGWIGTRSASSFSTLMLLLPTVFVVLYGAVMLLRSPSGTRDPKSGAAKPFTKMQTIFMFGTVIFLVVNNLLVGRFVGFSILGLIATALAATATIYPATVPVRSAKRVDAMPSAS